MSDSLYRNSIFMMASTLFMSATGFIFWIACAKLFSTHEVGIATSLLSAVALLSSFSLLGYNNGLIRYFHVSNNGNSRFNTSMTIVSIASVVVSAIFVGGLGIFSPKLQFLQDNSIEGVLFIFTVLITSQSAILDSVFIANKKASYIFTKTLVQNSIKCVSPFLLVALGAFGIFTANIIATVTALFISLWFLIIKLKLKFRLTYDKQLDKEMRTFSLANYSASFIERTTSSVLPLIIINTLGTSASGYFYIDLMIMNAIYIIPTSISQIMFAEGSAGSDNLKHTVIKSVKLVAPLMIVAIIAITLFGKIILGIIGKEYAANGYTTLVLLCVAGIPVSIKVLANVIMNIDHKVKYIIVTNIVTAVTVIGSGYLLIGMGLKGIAIGWIIGEVIGAGLSVALLIKNSSIFESTHTIAKH